MIKRALTVLTLSLGLTAGPAGAAVAAEPLGGLNLEAYCQSLGFDGLVWVDDLQGPQAAINNFHCVTNTESLHQISYERACQYEYGVRAVRFQFLDLDDATSGVCFLAP